MFYKKSEKTGSNDDDKFQLLMVGIFCFIGGSILLFFWTIVLLIVAFISQRSESYMFLVIKIIKIIDLSFWFTIFLSKSFMCAMFTFEHFALRFNKPSKFTIGLTIATNCIIWYIFFPFIQFLRPQKRDDDFLPFFSSMLMGLIAIIGASVTIGSIHAYRKLGSDLSESDESKPKSA